jgi:DNA-3-methyladenine glycosylase
MASTLPRSFYERSAIPVARELLGARLVRRVDGQRIAGIITETEAYQGEEDLACHARAGLTPRTQIMYGPAGRAYVYFTYGVHWMLNVVTEPEGSPAAVLIRGMQPVEGFEAMQRLRPAGTTDGPAKLTQALAITGALNGVDICTPGGELWIEPGDPIPDEQVTTGPRVGIHSVPEPWRSIPWRFLAHPAAGEHRALHRRYV